MLENLIDNIIKPLLEKNMNESQSGCRKGQSIYDHILTIEQLIEKK